MFTTSPGPITSRLDDPDMVGSAAYRAVHELLCDAEESASHADLPGADADVAAGAGGVDVDVVGSLLAELDAVAEWLPQLRAQLREIAGPDADLGGGLGDGSGGSG